MSLVLFWKPQGQGVLCARVLQNPIGLLVEVEPSEQDTSKYVWLAWATSPDSADIIKHGSGPLPLVDAQEQARAWAAGTLEGMRCAINDALNGIAAS